MLKLCDCEFMPGNSTELVNCTGHQKLKEALQGYFKFPSFRKGQLEALLPIAHGRDVFVQMPTGGGKSLCMFLLPLAIGGSAAGIIISPLVSLMDQQVYNVVAS